LPNCRSNSVAGFAYLAIVFIVLTIIAYVADARGIAGLTAGIARIFIILAIISFFL
jgi:uncharacterized membrane protein YtjA (UPF0391 family)